MSLLKRLQKMNEETIQTREEGWAFNHAHPIRTFSSTQQIDYLQEIFYFIEKESLDVATLSRYLGLPEELVGGVHASVASSNKTDCSDEIKALVVFDTAFLYEKKLVKIFEGKGGLSILGKDQVTYLTTAAQYVARKEGVRFCRQLMNVPFLSLDVLSEYAALAGLNVIQKNVFEAEIAGEYETLSLRFIFNEKKEIGETRWINQHNIEKVYWQTTYGQNGRRMKDRVYSKVYKNMEMIVNYHYDSKGNINSDITNGHALYHYLAEEVIKLQENLNIL